MTDQTRSIPQNFTVPDRFMVWHSNPNLSHVGTWSIERYPEEAVEAVRADTIPALLAAARANVQRELFSAWIRRDLTQADFNTPAPEPVQEAATVLPSGKWCECGLPHETGGPCWECRIQVAGPVRTPTTEKRES